MMGLDSEPFSQYLMLKNNCDPDEPLLSRTVLGQTLSNIPLDRLNSNDLRKLSIPLNKEQLIPTSDGLPRDYRGIAELIGYSLAEVESRFKKSHNPAKSLFEALIDNHANISQSSRPSPTLNDLLRLLEKIERFDIIDDALHLFVRVATDYYVAKQKSLTIPQSPDSIQICVQNGQIHDDDAYSKTRMNQVEMFPADNNQLVDSIKHLTIDDTLAQTTNIYDAFVCFAPKDYEYANDLLSFLQHNDLRVTTSQDLEPGLFEHDQITQMIDSRCMKVIIILTPNFARSKECKFQTKFASELNFKGKSPKIIPIVYEPYDDNELPSIIKVLSKIDLSDCRNRQWQMQRLLRCLQIEKQPTTTKQSSPCKIFTTRDNLERKSRQCMIRAYEDDSSASYSPSDDRTREVGPIPIVEVMDSQKSGEMFVPSSDNRSRSFSSGRNWFKNIMRRSARADDSTSSWSSSRVNLINNSRDSS